MKLKAFFRKIIKPLAIIGGGLLIIILGIADHLTGHVDTFSILYLVPILLVTWQTGLLFGISMAVLADITWWIDQSYIADTIPDYEISYYILVLRLGLFVLGAFLLFLQRKRLYREINSARTDSLTGASNSRFFIELIDYEIERCRRFKQPFSIAYMDIDNFKQINDTRGHKSGDELLQEVAKRIKANIRQSDVVIRIGGDEFSVFMPLTGTEQAYIAMNRVKKSLDEFTKAGNWPVSFSIGVLSVQTGKCKATELIDKADKLMYSVKKSGKNSIKFDLFG